MTDQREPVDITALFEDGREIEAAIKKGAQQAVRIHKALGHEVATWQDGKVVWIQPEDIVLDDDN